MSKVLKLVVMVAVLLVVVTVFLTLSITTKRNNLQGRWSQLETQLEQRNALIQELLPLIKQYASYEKDLLQKVEKENITWKQAGTITEKIILAKEIDLSLEQLLLVPKPFPELRADNNFIKITEQVKANKSQIAMEALRYNEAVRDFNTSVSVLPGTFIGKFLKYSKIEEYSKGKIQ